MQDCKQCRVGNRRLGVTDEVGEDGTPEGLQEEATQLSDPAVQRGGGGYHHPRAEVREEALGGAQGGALALGATQSLQERERKYLRVREVLEPFAAPAGCPWG